MQRFNRSTGSGIGTRLVRGLLTAGILGVIASQTLLAAAPTETIVVEDGKTTIKFFPTVFKCGNPLYYKCSICDACGRCADGKYTISDSSSSAPSPEACERLGTVHSKNQSYIDNVTFNYHHYAMDYKLGKGSMGCTSCSGGFSAGSLINLELERRHRSRDQHHVSSFGPGVYCTYDTKVYVYPVGGGLQIDVFNPKSANPTRLVDGLNGDVADGVFVDQRNKNVKNARLLDGADQTVSSLVSAVKIRMTAHDGSTWDFELMDLDSTYSGSPGGLGNTDITPPNWQAIYSFDDGSGTTASDSSGGGHDATFNGTLNWVGSGKIGGALEFDGGGHLSVPAAALADVKDAITVSVWVFGDTTQPQDDSIIYASDAGGNRVLNAHIPWSNGNVYWDAGNTGATYDRINKAAPASSYKGAWNHWAFTKDARTGFMEIYLNGTYFHGGNLKWNDMDGITSFLIGTHQPTSDEYDGMIDELRISNRVLSRPQIADLAGVNRIGQWPLDDGSGTTATDVSGNGNDGTVHGATWVAGKVGSNALQFDGVDDYVSIGNPDLLNVYDTVTVSAWIKPEATDGFRTAVAHGYELVPQSEIALRINNGNYEIMSWTGTVHGATSPVPAGDLNTWVHLAGTYDGEVWRLYRNGILVAANRDPIGAPQVNGDWAIGARGNGTERFFKGAIDDARVYGRALSADEIAAMSQVNLLAGRLVKVADRNGYSVDLTYRDGDFTAQELADSPDRRWQINTVTDPYDRAMTFNYKATQESGRWVVEKIDLPNGSDVDYEYADGKLSKVVHPDATESTFVYGWDTETQATTIEYNDAGASGTHRKKTAYLTNSIVLSNQSAENWELYNQSSLLARMIVNKEDEVSYLNMFDTDHISGNISAIYEGSGKLKQVHGAHEIRHFADGWTLPNPSQGFDGIVGTLEPTFTQYAGVNLHAELPTGEVSRIQDAQGRFYDYAYDADAFQTRKTYSDTTIERYSYNAFKQVTRHEDRLGRVTRNTYDANGNLTLREVGIVNAAVYEQVTPDRTDGAIDDKNVTIANGFARDEYASFGSAYFDGIEDVDATTQSFLPASVTSRMASPQPIHLKKSDTDARNNTTHYVYDDDNFLIAVVDPKDDPTDTARAVTEYEYDTAGRLSRSIDPRNRDVEYVYDGRDRVILAQYHDDSTERWAYGLPGGGDENLVVAQQDRQGTVNSFEYDDHGRRAKTITASHQIPVADVRDETKTDLAALLAGNEVTDPSIRIEETCEYLDGTNLRTECVRAGEKTTYAYDYRHRVVETTVNPRKGKVLTTSRTHANNLLFASTDAYGRSSYNVYRASDNAMIRSVMGLVPDFTLADETAAANLTRDLEAEGATPVGNARYLITDYIKDAEGQSLTNVDPRNNEYTMVYDSRGRSVERTEASGTAVAAKTETVYDAQSNVVEVRTPRYFDNTDAGGFNKANVEMVYTGRNLLKTRTVAADDTGSGGAVASESFAYFPDRTTDTKTDFRGNGWQTLWDPCCRRVIAQIQPAADVDGSGTDKHAVSWQNYNLYGDVVHTATFYVTAPANVPLPPLNRIVDIPDSETVHESTTIFDARHRPVAMTRWLSARGSIDPNGSVPIAGPHETSQGLTTRYFYDEDLTDGVGLDSATGAPVDFANAAGTGTVSGNVSIKKLLDELEADDDVENGGDGTFYDSALQDGYATVVINPEGEISVAITDGAGRSVASGVIEPPIVAGLANTNANDPITWGTQHYDSVVTLTGRFSNGSGGTQIGDALETFSMTALNHINRSRTDSAGRTVEAEDAAQEVTFLSYDNNSNRIRVRDANSVGLDCVLDARNRDIKCTDTQGDITETVYDANNNVVIAEDAKDKDTVVVYDARDRRVMVTGRNGGITLYSYDDNNNLETIEDADSEQGILAMDLTEYEYDPRNLKVVAIYPGHNGGASSGNTDWERVEYTHDTAGRSRINTDQNGDTVTYSFDMADRLGQRDYRTKANSPSGTIADSDVFTHDAASRMLTAASGRYSNTVTMAYDDASRLTDEDLAVNFGTARTYAASHIYDDDNRRTQTTYPNSKVVDRTYTDRDQLDQVDYDSSMVIDIAYDAGMRETQRGHGNGLFTRRQYNRNDNLVTNIINETTLNAANRPDASSVYAYDANKNPTSETTGAPGSAMVNYSWTTSGGTTPGYDDEDRLTYWTRSASGAGSIHTQEWPVNYAAGGSGGTGLSYVGDWTTVKNNGVAQSRTHDQTHQLTAIGGSAQTFDPKGNQLRGAGDTVDRFTWDFDNKMKAADTNQDSTDDLELTYDALGRRVSKDDGTTHTVYVCAGQQVVTEYLANDDPSVATPQQVYVYGTYVDEAVMKIDTANGKLYYHANRQYSVTAMTDSTGTVQERYAYTAYGVTTILAPDGTTVRATSTVGNSYMYTGRRLDAEFASGSEDTLYYYRARYYDPNQGRFIGRDPLEYVDGMSMYEYVGGRSTVMLDSSGTVYSRGKCPAIGGLAECVEHNVTSVQGLFATEWKPCDGLEGVVFEFARAYALSKTFKKIEKLHDGVGPAIGTAAGLLSACECRIRFITMQQRIWRGEFMIDHGFFTFGSADWFAVRNRTVGKWKKIAYIHSIEYRLTIGGKQVFSFGEVPELLKIPESLHDYPASNFNQDQFDYWVPGGPFNKPKVPPIKKNDYSWDEATLSYK